ncbi:MAG: universal stress protein [Proteobacteria bacterium]|nr:universal stress protein [Pseudomonadota bacterium]
MEFPLRRYGVLKYQHVLVAVDLSPLTEQIISQAKQIADDSKALLSLVHVMEHSPVAYGGEFSIPVDVNLEQSLEKEVRGELQKLGDKFQIPVDRQYLESGAVKLAVTDLAESLHADLIVVGTHGHHGLDLLLGSRANAILHRAQCDVLVIRVKE